MYEVLRLPRFLRFLVACFCIAAFAAITGAGRVGGRAARRVKSSAIGRALRSKGFAEEGGVCVGESKKLFRERRVFFFAYLGLCQLSFASRLPGR